MAAATNASSADATIAPRNPNRYEGAAVTTMPSTATPINPAVRATALLMPDATPACSTPTEFITVVVNGATKSAPPNPRIVAAGKNVVQYDPSVPGRANARKPRAARVPPTTSGVRAPMRATKPPDQRDRTTMMATKGSSAAPAAVGV